MSKSLKGEPDLEYHNNGPIPHEALGTIADHDDVFGEISEDGPNYRNVSISCLALCFKN